jgi:Flp pilus assembly protein TadD
MAISRSLQLHHAQRAVKADPKNAMARFYLALGLWQVNKDFAGAEREFRVGIRIDPSNGGSHSNLGSLLGLRKDHVRRGVQLPITRLFFGKTHPPKMGAR